MTSAGARKAEGRSASTRRWLPRRFPPTREGWWFLLGTLLVGAAAVNAGLNLLFLVFGMMLFLILASGVLSELCLRELTVQRHPPAAVHAGTPFLMGISVGNGKRRTPTFSLEVEDLVGQRPVDRRCYFLKIPAGRRQETAYRHVIPRRGVYRLTGFRLATRFPFGLIRKSRDVENVSEMLVYPALVPLADADLPLGVPQDRASSSSRAARAGEFLGLREFRAGDDPRQIHWRLSAKRGRWLVRESEDEAGRVVLVRLEMPPGNDVGANDESFERAVSLAASAVVALLRRGFSVGLRAGDVSVPAGSGPAHATALLRALALVSPSERRGGAVAPVFGMAVLRVRHDGSGLVLEDSGSARVSA